MINRLRTFFSIFSEVRKAYKSDGNEADTERHTKAIMAAAGVSDFGEDEPGPNAKLSEEAVTLLTAPAFEDLYTEDNVLNAAHISLIRQARLNWNGVEVGAPELDVAQPYRDGHTLGLLAGLLGDSAGDLEKAEFLIRHRSAIQIFLEEAELAPGHYVLKNIGWTQVERAGAGLEGFAELFAIGRDMSVEVTEDDIALASAATWEWPDEDTMESALDQNEVAGPTVDPKRPYGEMSYYQLDVHQVLGWPVESEDEDGYVVLTEAQEEEAMRLHFRQLGAMQAMFENAQHPLEGS